MTLKKGVPFLADRVTNLTFHEPDKRLAIVFLESVFQLRLGRTAPCFGSGRFQRPSHASILQGLEIVSAHYLVSSKRAHERVSRPSSVHDLPAQLLKQDAVNHRGFPLLMEGCSLASQCYE